MRDKPTTPERDLPPPCLNCRSLHKQYGSSLCENAGPHFSTWSASGPSLSSGALSGRGSAISASMRPSGT